ARLMQWLPQVGKLDWRTITQNSFTEYDSSYKLPPNGLLGFAVKDMVDPDDLLMIRSLFDFYTTLMLEIKDRPSDAHDDETVAAQYLISQGVHNEAMNVWLDPSKSSYESMFHSFLYSASADYISAYCNTCPQHCERYEDTGNRILHTLQQKLSGSFERLIRQETFVTDLKVLCALPRSILLSDPSVLTRLPTRIPNKEIFSALAVIFHGPVSAVEEIRWPPSDIDTITTNSATTLNSTSANAKQAHDLCTTYLSANSSFYTDLITAADIVAMPDVATAAMSLISAIITANWTSDTPAIATLLDPQTANVIVPWLLKPPQTFTNLVGGRGDTESAAWKVARAKFDALRLFQGRLQAYAHDRPGPREEQLLVAVEERVRGGVWGETEGGGEVGGRIATLEM
ncbi:hypothetical protein LTS18_010871, partial [Coniosporium uncinatum]